MEVVAERQIIDITQLVDEQKIGAFHIKIIFLTFLVMLSDGYDLQAAALAGPGLVQSWHVDRALLGPVFSASLFGMLFGGPLFAYVGDRFGRKAAIISGAVLYGVVTLVAAGASSVNELIVLRFITGLGLGGLPPNCIALDAEFAPKRVRATVIVVMYLGVTVGSMLPAAVTAAMGHTYRWQTLFIIGGIVPLAAAVILFFGLPESIKYLVLHRKSRAQIARLVASIQPGLSLAPDAEFVLSEAGGKPSKLMVALLFSGGLAWITSLVWLLNVVNLMANFFLHNWMPILFRDDGLTIQQMGIATAMYDVGGIFGALVASRLLDKWGIKTLVALFALSIPLVAAIGMPGMMVFVLGASVFMTGFCIVGIQLGLNATVGIIYPTAIRANGAGWASSIGRFGAILGPLIGGWLIAMHASVQQLFLAPALPMAVGVVAAFALMRFCVARFGGDRLGEAAVPRPSFEIASQLSAPALRKQDSWPT